MPTRTILKLKLVMTLKLIPVLVGSMYWMLTLSQEQMNDLHLKVSFNLFLIIAYVVVIISLLTDEEVKS